MNVPYNYINSNEKLENALKQLSQAQEIAVDFEGDFSRFKYGITLCLVQMYDGESAYIIDPFAVDMHLLTPLFMGEQKKVMFDPSGDFILLKHTYNMTMQNVIDVQLAAKLLEYPKLSLTVVLQECMGVEIINKKKFQTANWTRRPLEEELIAYAISDVIYLLQVKDMLVEQVRERGKYGLFLKLNRALSSKDYTLDLSKRYLKIKNAGRLHGVHKIYLKYFFECRDRIAKAKNLPPNHIMQNETLLKISQAPPKSKHDWLALTGVPYSFSKYISDFSHAKERADHAVKKMK